MPGSRFLGLGRASGPLAEPAGLGQPHSLVLAGKSACRAEAQPAAGAGIDVLHLSCALPQTPRAWTLLPFAQIPSAMCTSAKTVPSQAPTFFALPPPGSLPVCLCELLPLFQPRLLSWEWLCKPGRESSEKTLHCPTWGTGARRGGPGRLDRACHHGARVWGGHDVSPSWPRKRLWDRGPGFWAPWSLAGSRSLQPSWWAWQAYSNAGSQPDG